jgi:type II restriction enzyme
MPSPECERAIEDALSFGAALMRNISPNDVGLTGGHQYGYYLPKDETVWPLFTPQAPEKGKNHTHPIEVLWQNGRVTNSNIKWYGTGTRSEYRLTGFGKDFPFISPLVVGDLLVLIPEEQQKRFRGYVLDNEEDIDEITMQLGASPARRWSLFRRDVVDLETEEECIEKRFRDFAAGLTVFPAVDIFTNATMMALVECLGQFGKMSPDDAILRSVDAEFQLFRRVERQVCSPVLVRVFADIEDFIATAQTILQRRKSRAGRSLENHVEYFLKAMGIPHEMQPDIEGEPDCVIPSVEAYRDQSYPDDKLIILGVKRTCRDRWRQVLNEGKRIKSKHLFTLEQGISGKQLTEMQTSGVTLVVPRDFHKQYPPKERADVVITFDGFIADVKARLA